MNKSKYVVLKGLLVGLKCPNIAALAVTADASRLQASELNELRDRLNDAIQIIEEAYSGKPTNRKIKILWNEKAEQVTMPNNNEIVKRKRKVAMIQFLPYPSRLANVIETTRVQAYQAINEYGEVAQRLASGHTIRALYILPFTTAPDFFKQIDHLNTKLGDVRRALTNFLQETNNLESIRRILEDYDVSTDLDESISMLDKRVPDIIVMAAPIALDPASTLKMIDEIVAEEDNTGNKEGGELAALKDMLTHSIENAKQDMLDSIIASMKKRIEVIVRSTLALNVNPRVTARKINLLEKIMKGIGLYDKNDEDMIRTFERLRKIAAKEGENDKRVMAKLFFNTTDKDEITAIVTKALLKV